jgi:pimeloyl-ACP methyl ester carboxylesterase
MRRSLHSLAAAVLLAAILPVTPLAAQEPSPGEPQDSPAQITIQTPQPAEPAPAPQLVGPLPDGCAVGLQPSGANYLVCMPVPGGLPWNGELVVFAHGYVDPDAGPTDWAGQLLLPDGTFLPSLITSLGYAFAGSSYSRNGLAVTQGIADTAELVGLFKLANPATQRVYLVGVSEGGLITALSVERLPALYSGGVAACGPIGDFRSQINYLGDFRVLYDYFFPGVLPPTAVDIPEVLYDNWLVPGGYAQAVAVTVANPANASLTAQLLKTSKAPVDAKDPASVVSTTVGVLDYNVRATENAKTVLGGQPFGNLGRWYYGSANDFQLNRSVARFSAAPSALSEIAANYQTSGRLSKPLVGLHTTGDPIVPFWHALLYRAKTLMTGSALKYINLPVARYGHCNFKSSEALAAFGLLVYRVTGQLPIAFRSAIADPEQQAVFDRLMDENRDTQ